MSFWMLNRAIRTNSLWSHTPNGVYKYDVLNAYSFGNPGGVQCRSVAEASDGPGGAEGLI